MKPQANEGLWALSEKEKQTLRLIVRGHDAKSTARSLGLSVHTINERLRDARHKMAVSSSREAARLLFEAEGGTIKSSAPDSLGDAIIGEDVIRPPIDQEGAPSIGVGRRASRYPWIIFGVFFMTLALGILAMIALPNDGPTSQPTIPTSETQSSEVAEKARQWLILIDQARWEDSYQATSASFRAANALELWATTSKQVRAPLGAAMSRSLVGEESVAAPPNGYKFVKFRTQFAKKADVVETVTLDREGGTWRVVGVTIGD